MLVIADANRPVALAGVMGGLDSEVSNATTTVLLESARFDPLSVRSTARALAMASDSSYRFERGIDPLLPECASLRATQLLVELAGGEVAGDMVIAGASGHTPKNLWLRLPRLRQVLGIELPTQQVMEALTRLRLSPVLRNERIDVTVPSYRLDLNLEIDLVEEVARVVGYDKVPMREEMSIRLAAPQPEKQTAETIVSTLVAGGYFQAVTFSFVTDSLRGAFVPPRPPRCRVPTTGCARPMPVFAPAFCRACWKRFATMNRLAPPGPGFSRSVPPSGTMPPAR